MNELKSSHRTVPPAEEVLLRLEQDCAAIVPSRVLDVLLAPLRFQASLAEEARDGAAIEAAINQLEDVLEAFWVKQTAQAP